MKTVLVRTTLLILSMGLWGCQQQADPLLPNVDTATSHTVKKEATIVVPDSVRGKWKAVRIAVLDKSAAKATIYTVPIGGRITLPHSTMTIVVDAFLPAFVIEGSTMTSSGNALKNPGAKVRITENGAVIFNAWLFSRYPTTHAFMHPRYAFTLMDGVPATL
ncbi:MAG TPA: hypothetical protein VIH45_14175 [Desulfuromonadaceae bacterium]